MANITNSRASTQPGKFTKIGVYGCALLTGGFCLLISFFMFLLSGYMQDQPLLAYTFMLSPVLVILGMVISMLLITLGFSYLKRK